MIFILKMFLYFSISLTILSIPIKNHQLFYHINLFAEPFTQMAYNKAAIGLKMSKKELVKLFTNSSLKTVDKVKTQYSASKRKNHFVDVHTDIHEKYTHEEKQLLKKILIQSSSDEN